MQIPRWQNVLFLKNSLKISTLLSSTTPATTAAAAATSIHFVASFHSTPTSCEKWKNKWNAWLPDADTARTWPWDTLFMDECLSKMFVIDHIQCWHSLCLQEYLHFQLEYSVYRATIAAQQTYKKLVWISSLLFYILFRSLFYIYKSSIWHWCIARRVFQCSRCFL